MKKSLISLILIVLPAIIAAQGLKNDGNSADNLVPSDWEKIVAQGDLNKDGIADLVVIATPTSKENMKTRHDGYVYNFNQPVLAIYWGSKDSSYKLYKQYDNVIPARPSEFLSITPTISVTERGVLKIELEYFSSAGGWDSSNSAYLYRYQQGDFFLIGKDESTLTRNTGATSTISENYLTGKRSVTTGNVQSNKKPSAKWSNIPKAPLQPLGTPLE